MSMVDEHRKRQFKIPLDQAEDIFRDAMKVAMIVRVDQLVPGKMARHATDKGIEWVLQHILKSKRPHLVCIERGPMFVDSIPYFDFGGSTMCYTPEYFIWVEVPIPAAEQIIEKYQLKQR